MSDYTKSTNFAAKDALLSGNPNKVVSGTEINTEFDAIQTSNNSKADKASPTFTGTVNGVNASFTGTFNADGAATFGAITASGDVDFSAGTVTLPTIASLTITSADINGGTVDGTVIGGTTPAAVTATTLNATGGGSLTGTWSDLGTVTTVDINGGSIDDAVIGANVAAAGSFTTLSASGEVLFNGSGASATNLAIGDNALASNTSGTENVALGADALSSITTSQRAVAVGYKALEDNTSSFSTAVGAYALQKNTSGSQNTALGYATLDSNLTGSQCTAVGYNALTNSTGTRNTAVGANALDTNSTGTLNVAVGAYALDANTTGSENTAVGYEALDANTTASESTAVGRGALTASTGASNTAIGHNAGSDVTSGSNLTLIGHNAQPSSATATNEITFGDTNVTSARFGQAAITTTGSITGGTASFSQATVDQNVITLTGANSFTYNFITRSDGSSDGRRLDVNVGSSAGEIALSNAAGNLALFADDYSYITQSTVIGSTSVTPDGTMHVYSGSAGAVAANSSADDLVIENSTSGGASVLTPDASTGYLIFGSPSDNLGANITWNYNADLFTLGSSKTGASVQIKSGNGTTALDIDSSQDIVAAGTFQINDNLKVTTTAIVGSNSVTPDGTLHVYSGSAGTVTPDPDANDLVVEGNAATGISILTPDGSDGTIAWTSPSTTGDYGARIRYQHTAGNLIIATEEVGDTLILRSDASVDNLTLSGASGSEQGNFSGSLVVGDSSLTPDGTLHVYSGNSGATVNVAADDLVVENSASGGASFMVPNANEVNVQFVNPAGVGAGFTWDYTNSQFRTGTSKVGASWILRSDNLVPNLTLSGASGSELTEAAGDVTVGGYLTESYATGITAGSTQTQGGATLLTAQVTIIGTVGTTGDGVKLPALSDVASGTIVKILNAAASNAQVWPNTNDAIDANADNAVDPAALVAGESREYIKDNAAIWRTYRG